MAEYIERAKLRKTLKEEMQILKETPGKDDWDKGLMQGIKESIMYLNVAPAADVVEVVRCKECKYYKKGSCDCHSVWPDQYSTGYDCRPDDDDFCSYGEREEDKQNEAD